MSTGLARLGMSWTEALLVVVTAAGIYATVILLSRLFGQRQFSVTTSYDLAFTFALGSVVGRVILVRTSLAAGVLGLATLFALHALSGRLHHSVGAVHDLIQNRPVLLAVDGRILDANLHAARTSRTELYQQIRAHGHGSLDDVGAVVLERNGGMSVLDHRARRDPEVFAEVITGDDEPRRPPGRR